jgi:nicotinamidase-related amidase
MFYYCSFSVVSAITESRLFGHVVFSVSSNEQAPNAKMMAELQRLAAREKTADVRIITTRVITPADYDEFIKMGVRGVKI